jgi:hypothetical protein
MRKRQGKARNITSVYGTQPHGQAMGAQFTEKGGSLCRLPVYLIS